MSVYWILPIRCFCIFVKKKRSKKGSIFCQSRFSVFLCCLCCSFFFNQIFAAVHTAPTTFAGIYSYTERQFRVGLKSSGNLEMNCVYIYSIVCSMFDQRRSKTSDSFRLKLFYCDKIMGGSKSREGEWVPPGDQ